MTTLHKLPRSVPGSALIMSLMTTAIIGLLLASYLSLIQTQNVSVARSQAWNVSIAVAEGGVEEALAQLNPGIKPWDTNATLDLAANGWTTDADGNYRPQQRRYLGSNYYDVVIAPGTSPVIYSTGYTATPFGCAPISRTIQVTTTNAQLTVIGMGAQGNIDFKGFNVESDSYDSSTDSGSTDGRYAAAKARDHGDVASNSGLINVGNAKIKGHLRIGPTASDAMGSNGSIGSSTWVNGGNVGIEYNWLVNDFNAEFWSVLEPYQSGTTPVGGQFPATGGTNYTYLLNSEGEKYYMTSLTMKQSDTMYVANNATLYVTGNILMQNKSQIVLAQGVSLTIYVGGASADFTVVNNYGKASNFSYYGLDGNTSITYGGNNSLVGSLYAPNADLKIGGGGSSIYDFQGSCMVKTITMNGHFKFHYDEALTPPFRGYVATSWKEL